ncbi:hypothetical protein ACFQ6N_17325 [Kitasatospora sp. NPDC056446]|uniref:hypothetical protein n=1 Tax=Kitasatospora sp. NPDC056446 TaxID=3345819 RepID=UPI0036C25E56
MILAVTVHDDLHVIAVQHAARSRGHTQFHIVECDTIGGRQALSWRSHSDDEDVGSGTATATVLTSEGFVVAPSEAVVLWWRRPRADQEIAAHAGSTHERSLVNNDCRGALGGILASSFHGQWISPPEATDRAADKVYQLAVAREAGFRVPRTLISQSREDVIAFTRQVGRTIVKPVVGARGPSLWTRWIDDPESIPATSFEVCPATRSTSRALDTSGSTASASACTPHSSRPTNSTGAPTSKYRYPHGLFPRTCADLWAPY